MKLDEKIQYSRSICRGIFRWCQLFLSIQYSMGNISNTLHTLTHKIVLVTTKKKTKSNVWLKKHGTAGDI